MTLSHVGVLTGVRVASADAFGALGDPQRDDLLVLERVVQVHVAVEEVLHLPAVLGALGERAHRGDLVTQSGQLGLELGDGCPLRGR